MAKFLDSYGGIMGGITSLLWTVQKIRELLKNYKISWSLIPIRVSNDPKEQIEKYIQHTYGLKPFHRGCFLREDEMLLCYLESEEGRKSFEILYDLKTRDIISCEIVERPPALG